MNYEQKRKILNEYKSINHEIWRLELELEGWETIATSITQKISPVTVSNNDISSRVEKCAIMCAEIRQEIDRLKKLSEANKYLVTEAIEGIKDSRKREIMSLRFIEGVGVHKIAVLYGKEDQSIHRIIQRTIKKLKL